jgi:hypothetical protein
MKLVMTLLVRDEDDILDSNLAFHLAQGVDFFIITDNLSVDGTRDIIQSYVRRGLAICLPEAGDDYSQYRWVTRMARMAAAKYAADWVINSDADEFWVSTEPTADLNGSLARLAPNVSVLDVPRSNFVPVDEVGLGFCAERMTLREAVSLNTEGHLLPSKVCHRAMHDIDVDQGNHAVRRNGLALPARSGPLRILHYPVRSYRRFENKIVKGGAAYERNTELSPAVGATWRNLYKIWQQGGLQARYRDMIPSPDVIQKRMASGELLYDDTVMRTLQALDPAAVAARA